jgi:BON domain
MSKPKLFGAAAVLLSVIGISCGQKTAAPNDQSLVTDIQSKLYADNTTRQGNVKVDAKDGVVTLSGDVPSSDIELQAMKIANGTAGVRSVNDQMKVNGAAGSTAANEPPSGPGSTPGNSFTGSSASASAHKLGVQPARTTPAPAVAESSPSEAAESNSSRTSRAERGEVTIPAGDRISIRTTDTIDSGKANVGQTFRASLDAPLTSEGRVIVPAGAPATLQIQSVQAAGRIKGSSELSVRVTSIEYRGKTYPVNSSVYADAGNARGKQTAIKTGAGAAAGAIIGAIAGGGKGAAIGSAAGGGAGFGWNALTHGQQVKIPSETILTFRLAAPLTVPAPRQ